MPRTWDLAIFVPIATIDGQTDCFNLCVCVRGNYACMALPVWLTLKSLSLHLQGNYLDSMVQLHVSISRTCTDNNTTMSYIVTISCAQFMQCKWIEYSWMIQWCICLLKVVRGQCVSGWYNDGTIRLHISSTWAAIWEKGPLGADSGMKCFIIVMQN